MSTDVIVTQDSEVARLQAAAEQVKAAMLEQVMMAGDLSALAPSQRLMYYRTVCDVLGLNPATRPFEYMKFQGKLILYPRKEAAEQLRDARGISITDMRRETIGDVLLVIVKARAADGREDTATGSVPLVYPALLTEWKGGQKVTVAHPKAGQPLSAEDLPNAIMKAETKAKRRVTLSLCGLGGRGGRAVRDDIDEEDVNGMAVIVDDNGEIVGQAESTKPKQLENPDLTRLRVMCKQVFGAKADEARAFIATKASNGKTTHTGELSPEQVTSALEWVEAEAMRRGWTRNPANGHWEPPANVSAAGDVPANAAILRKINLLGRQMYGDEWVSVYHGIIQEVAGAVKPADQLTADQAGTIAANLERQMADMPPLDYDQAQAELFGQ